MLILMIENNGFFMHPFILFGTLKYCSYCRIPYTCAHMFTCKSTCKCSKIIFDLKFDYHQALLSVALGSFHFFVVFWRSNRGNIHYVTGGVGNNIFGGCFALVLFLILQRFEDIDQVQLYSKFCL